MVDCRGDSVHIYYSGHRLWSTAIAEENRWTDGLRHSTVLSSSYSDSRHSFHYPIPDISMQPPTKWVYEWEDPYFYTMLVQEWQTISAWTGQTWQHYKVDLLRVRGIALMSTTEYQTASQMGVLPYLR